jgi:hypothetical protein
VCEFADDRGMLGSEDLTHPALRAPLLGGDSLEPIEIGDYCRLDTIKTFNKPAIAFTKIALARIISVGLVLSFNHDPGFYSSVD